MQNVDWAANLAETPRHLLYPHQKMKFAVLETDLPFT